jgi:hypothetical protein
MEKQTLTEEKKELVFHIKKLENQEFISQIKNLVVEHLNQRPTQKQLKKLRELSTTIKEKTDLDEIIREQNWKPSTQEEIDEIIKGFDWEISDEEFIELLKDI